METRRVIVVVGESAKLDVKSGMANRATCLEEVMSLLSLYLEKNGNTDGVTVVLEEVCAGQEEKVAELAGEFTGLKIVSTTYVDSSIKDELTKRLGDKHIRLDTEESQNTWMESIGLVEKTNKVENVPNEDSTEPEEVETETGEVEKGPEGEPEDTRGGLDQAANDEYETKIKELEDIIVVKSTELERARDRINLLMQFRAEAETSERVERDQTSKITALGKQLEAMKATVESFEAEKKYLEDSIEQTRKDLEDTAKKLVAEEVKAKDFENKCIEHERKEAEQQEEIERQTAANERQAEVNKRQAEANKRQAEAKERLEGLLEYTREFMTAQENEVNRLLEVIDGLLAEMYEAKVENDGHEKESSARISELEVQIADALSTNDKLSKDIEDGKDREEKLGLTIEKISEGLRDKEALVEKLESQIGCIGVSHQQELAAKDNEIKVLKDRVETGDTEKENKVHGLESELMAEKDKRQLVEGENNRLSTELEAKKAELEGLRAAQEILKARLGSSGAPSVEDSAGEISRLRSETDSMRRTIRELEGKLEENKRNNERTCSNVDNKGEQSIKIEYTGRAKIIAVTGSGSYGVTTTAMSIANELNGKILYMDLDLVNPKADGWFGVTPINNSLVEIRSTLLRSGVGLLVSGMSQEYMDSKLDSVISLASGETSKHGDIYYFSGLCDGNVDGRRVVSANWNWLLNRLGKEFDYIVADLGKFGCSHGQAELGKEFMRIATKKVIVTLNEKCDVRNMVTKLNANGVHTGGVLWLLNMAESTAVDGTIKQAVNLATPIIVPRSTELRNRMTFGKAYGLRAKMEYIMKYVMA